MSFWTPYRASLKPLSVEEPIDVVWHRPLGYLVARACLPTPISADAITLASIAVGFASGMCIALDFSEHRRWAAILCTLSAVLDCADGQLARLRNKSSSFGRMLDGFADLLVMVFVLGGAFVYVARKGEPWWFFVVAVAAIPSTNFHLAFYDHYKNVYLRLTEPRFREGEDLETALERRALEQRSGAIGWMRRATWAAYVYYVKSQRDLLRFADPWTSSRLPLFPEYSARTAGIYEKHARGPMRGWRSMFGLGTHVFVFSLAMLFDRLEWYVYWRIGLLNAICWFVLVPWQRRASRAAFGELGIQLPDQRGFVASRARSDVA